MVECWRTIQNNSLCLKRWDHEFVIYHKLTGDTHLLDDVGIAVLTYLKNNSADINAILDHIANTKRLEVDFDQLQELLASLSRYSLIHKVS